MNKLCFLIFFSFLSFTSLAQGIKSFIQIKLKFLKKYKNAANLITIALHALQQQAVVIAMQVEVVKLEVILDPQLDFV
jgi:hypothetical protein